MSYLEQTEDDYNDALHSWSEWADYAEKMYRDNKDPFTGKELEG